MRPLNLIIKKQWLDKILRGEKKEDYRDHSTYWDSRLDGKDGFYSTIRFQFGYSKECFYFKCDGIKKDIKNDRYVILIGKKLKESEVVYGKEKDCT